MEPPRPPPMQERMGGMQQQEIPADALNEEIYDTYLSLHSKKKKDMTWQELLIWEEEEYRFRKKDPNPAYRRALKLLRTKQPVAVLNELCTKKQWGQPEYVIIRDGTKRLESFFQVKCVLRGEEYIPE